MNAGGRALLLLLLTVAAGLGASEVLIDAAHQALERGDPARALALIAADDETPGRDGIATLRARALLALGRCEQALAVLDASEDQERGARGLRAQLRGECLLALERDHEAAIAALARAIELGGEGVAVDRCLVLIAEAAAAAGRHEVARRAAERVWIGWRRGLHAWRAGLVLARLEAAADPERARRLLTELRYRGHEPAQVATAELELCALLLESRPLDCLAVAREGNERHPDPRFVEFELQALLRIDPDQARRRLDELEREGPLPRFDPLRADLERRVAPADDPVATAVRRLDSPERDDALARLQGLAADHGAARCLLLWQGVPAPIATTPSDPVAAVADAAASLALDPATARGLLAATSVPSRGHPERQRLEALVPGLLATQVYAVVATRPDDPGLAGWRRLLQEEAVPAEIRGVAWAWAARERELAGDDAVPAWTRAAEVLPGDHPWTAQAAQRAARPLLSDLPPGAVDSGLDARRRATLRSAARLLSAAAWAGDGEDHLACRWLLAQALAQAGDVDEARGCIESLRQRADPARQAMLQRFLERLAAATHTVSTQVLP